MAGVDAHLLAAFRAYLPGALDDTRGLAILAPPAAGTGRLLMVLARQIGAALRDENIHLRERGGDLKGGRKKLCYLPGSALPLALGEHAASRALASEAASFVQDLDLAWPGDAARHDPPPGARPFDWGQLVRLLDERLAAGRPTFLTADPGGLPPRLAGKLRARLHVLELG
jgi:hypothetical protein